MAASAPSSGEAQNRRWWVGIGSALIVALGAVGTWWALASGPSPAEPVFRTTLVERRTVVATVDVTGYLEARNPRVVTAPRRGRLVEVMVTTGQTVAAGDALARLGDDGVDLALRTQRAQVAAAVGRLEDAKAQHRASEQALARARDLRGRGQTSEAALEEAVASEASAAAAVRIAQAELDRARQDLARAERDRTDTVVRAPMSGVVLSVPEELGVNVTPDGPVLFRLAAPLDRLRLVANVGEADIARLAVGQSSSFEVQAFPGEWFPAEIQRIGVLGERDQGVATYAVELDAPNPGGSLRPGMTAAVRFEVGRADDALVVREAAVRFVPEGAASAPPRSRVFKRVGPGQLEVVPVAVGVSDGAFTVVEAVEPGALREGDAVAMGYGDAAAAGIETNISLGGSP